jgi:hypothetical protein
MKIIELTIFILCLSYTLSQTIRTFTYSTINCDKKFSETSFNQGYCTYDSYYTAKYYIDTSKKILIKSAYSDSFCNYNPVNTTMAYPTQCTKSGIVYSTNMDVSNNNIEIPVSSNYEYKISSFSNSNCTDSPYMYQFSKKGVVFLLFGYVKQTISKKKMK